MSIGWAVLFAAADKFGENAVSDAVGFGINTGGLQCQFFQTGADDFVFGGGKTLIEQGTGFHFGADFVDGTGAKFFFGGGIAADLGQAFQFGTGREKDNGG